jgi:prepilin-type N-terminal cleavage/methylation domain-containing protein
MKEEKRNKFVSKKGFTLIELLVVVLIIGILAAIALPQYRKSVEKARMAEAQAIVSSIGKAQDSYRMAQGKPANKFAQLSVSVPNGVSTSTPLGGLSHVSGGAIRGEHFDYVISSAGDQSANWGGAIMAVREYNNGVCGFKYLKGGQLWCIQQNASGAENGCCVKIYNLTGPLTDGGWKSYKF